MKQKKFLFFLLFFFLFGVLGFARDFFFVNLNSIMFGLYYERTASLPVPPSMEWAFHFKYEQLYYLKYLFTLVCTLLYYLLSVFALKVLVRDVRLLRYLQWTYALLFSVAVMTMLYGYLAKEKLNDDEYTLSRWLMGILQSPLICLLLLASKELFKTVTNHDTKGQNHI